MLKLPQFQIHIRRFLHLIPTFIQVTIGEGFLVQGRFQFLGLTHIGGLDFIYVLDLVILIPYVLVDYHV